MLGAGVQSPVFEERGGGAAVGFPFPTGPMRRRPHGGPDGLWKGSGLSTAGLSTAGLATADL